MTQTYQIITRHTQHRNKLIIYELCMKCLCFVSRTNYFLCIGENNHEHMCTVQDLPSGVGGLGGVGGFQFVLNVRL